MIVWEDGGRDKYVMSQAGSLTLHTQLPESITIENLQIENEMKSLQSSKNNKTRRCQCCRKLEQSGVCCVHNVVEKGPMFKVKRQKSRELSPSRFSA